MMLNSCVSLRSESKMTMRGEEGEGSREEEREGQKERGGEKKRGEEREGMARKILHHAGRGKNGNLHQGMGGREHCAALGELGEFLVRV